MNILGLQPGYTKNQLRNAYIRIVPKVSPNKGGKTENFIRVRKAYVLLSGNKGVNESEIKRRQKEANNEAFVEEVRSDTELLQEDKNRILGINSTNNAKEEFKKVKAQIKKERNAAKAKAEKERNAAKAKAEKERKAAEAKAEKDRRAQSARNAMNEAVREYKKAFVKEVDSDEELLQEDKNKILRINSTNKAKEEFKKVKAQIKKDRQALLKALGTVNETSRKPVFTGEQRENLIKEYNSKTTHKERSQIKENVNRLVQEERNLIKRLRSHTEEFQRLLGTKSRINGTALFTPKQKTNKFGNFRKITNLNRGNALDELKKEIETLQRTAFMSAVKASDLTQTKKNEIEGTYQSAKINASAVREFRKALRNKKMENRKSIEAERLKRVKESWVERNIEKILGKRKNSVLGQILYNKYESKIREGKIKGTNISNVINEATLAVKVRRMIEELKAKANAKNDRNTQTNIGYIKGHLNNKIITNKRAKELLEGIAKRFPTRSKYFSLRRMSRVAPESKEMRNNRVLNSVSIRIGDNRPELLEMYKERIKSNEKTLNIYETLENDIKKYNILKKYFDPSKNFNNFISMLGKDTNLNTFEAAVKTASEKKERDVEQDKQKTELRLKLRNSKLNNPSKNTFENLITNATNNISKVNKIITNAIKKELRLRLKSSKLNNKNKFEKLITNDNNTIKVDKILTNAIKAELTSRLNSSNLSNENKSKYKKLIDNNTPNVNRIITNAIERKKAEGIKKKETNAAIKLQAAQRGFRTRLKIIENLENNVDSFTSARANHKRKREVILKALKTYKKPPITSMEMSTVRGYRQELEKMKKNIEDNKARLEEQDRQQREENERMRNQRKENERMRKEQEEQDRKQQEEQDRKQQEENELTRKKQEEFRKKVKSLENKRKIIYTNGKVPGLIKFTGTKIFMGTNEFKEEDDLQNYKYTTVNGEEKILHTTSVKELEKNIENAKRKAAATNIQAADWGAAVRKKSKRATEEINVEEIRERIINAELGKKLQDKYIIQINQFLDGNKNININALIQEANGKIEEKYTNLRQKLNINIKKLHSGQKEKLETELIKAKKSSDFKRIEANVVTIRKKELLQMLKEKKVEKFKKSGFPQMINKAQNMNRLDTIQGEIEKLEKTKSSGYGGKQGKSSGSGGKQGKSSGSGGKQGKSSGSGGKQGKSSGSGGNLSTRREHPAFINGIGQNETAAKVHKGEISVKKK
jgi:hypothetical protein